MLTNLTFRERFIGPNSFKAKKKKKKRATWKDVLERANHRYKCQNSSNTGLGYKRIYINGDPSLYAIFSEIQITLCRFWKEMAKLATLISATPRVFTVITFLMFFCLCLSLKYIFVPAFHSVKKTTLNEIAGWQCFPLNRSSHLGALKQWNWYKCGKAPYCT